MLEFTPENKAKWFELAWDTTGCFNDLESCFFDTGVVRMVAERHVDDALAWEYSDQVPQTDAGMACLISEYWGYRADDIYKEIYDEYDKVTERVRLHTVDEF